MTQGLFRAAPLRTTRAPFGARGSPVIYAVFALGCPQWMASWQGWQTTRVFRRFWIMSAAHAGGLAVRLPRLASFRTWCTATLAGSPHISHLLRRSRASQLLPRIGDWTRLVVGQGRPLVPHQGYPAEPSDQWLLAVPFDPGFEALT